MARKHRRSGAARLPLVERPYRYDHEEHIVRNRTALLDAINGFYAAALERLRVEEMPADPTPRKPMTDGKTAARRRRMALARIVADTSDVPCCPPNHSRLREMRIPLRSLEALVAFLDSCFPYLPTPLTFRRSQGFARRVPKRSQSSKACYTDPQYF
ncbi:hypothetical protein E2562_020270 [Oryza meyeriana var. granulata]|uniref:Uncharacterized protein n=1 Tax=Oryza meyeriana var. granulata TaxID=110450 RepID=A0A6G1DL25_9ORYZ|nr:hypothetical protein E2562_020270 [Oryza meyeriana var. granulata]